MVLSVLCRLRDRKTICTFQKRFIPSKKIFRGRIVGGTGNAAWRHYNRKNPALRLKDNILPHKDPPLPQFKPPIVRHHAPEPNHPAPALRPWDAGDPVPDKFCVFAPWLYSNHQYKVMEGDRIMVDHLVDPSNYRVYTLDEDVVFKNVLLVANREKTILGRPLIPFCSVICRVEQVLQLPRTLWVRKFRRDRHMRRRGHRKWVTTLKVKKILVDMDAYEGMPHDKEYLMWEASLQERERALISGTIEIHQRFQLDPHLLELPDFQIEDLTSPELNQYDFKTNEIEDISQISD